MSVKQLKPTTPGQRGMSKSGFEEITADKPERSLIAKRNRTGGRSNTGRITTRHIGGGHKRQYRIIDFKRNKLEVPAKVATIEYDPNRTARIALLVYADGEKRYILAPDGLEVGRTVVAGKNADILVGQRAAPAEHPRGQHPAQHRDEARQGRPDRPRRRHLRPARGQGRGLRPAPHALRRDPQDPPGLLRDHRHGRQPPAREHRRSARPAAPAGWACVPPFAAWS